MGGSEDVWKGRSLARHFVSLICLVAAARTAEASFISNDYSGYFVARNAMAFQCVKDGFFRDPSNCTLFYRCADLTGERLRFQLFQFGCPPGTVYDDANSVCNHPQSVPSCSGSAGLMAIREKEGAAGSHGQVAKPVPGSRPTPLPIIKEVPGTSIPQPVLPNVPTSIANQRCQRAGLFRSPDDCRRFYICVDVFGNGTTYQLCEYPCPHGSVFSNRLSLCTEPHRAEPCGDNQVAVSSSTAAPQPPVIPPTGGSVQPPPVRPPVIGPPDSFVCAASGYFRHPTNCSRYFQCVNLTEDNRVFQRYQFICSPGTAFHESISQCDHPYNVPGCGASTVVVVTTPPSPTAGSSSTTTSGPLVTASTPRPATASPPAPPTRPVTATPPSPPTRPPTTPPPSSSSQRPPVEPVTPPEPWVGPACTAEGYLSHPTNCSRFFRCVNASSALQPNHYVKFEFACAPGTAFDPSINSCNHPDRVPACGGAPVGGSTTFTSIVSLPSSTPSPKPEVSTAVPVSTVTQPSTTSAPASTTTAAPSSTFQPITSPAVGSTTTHIVTEVPTATPLPLIPGGVVPNPVIAGSECQKDGFFRSPKNCSHFFRCVDILGNGQRFHRYDFMCGGGSVFDEAILACNHPNAVHGCGGSELPPAPITTQKPSPPTSTLLPVTSPAPVTQAPITLSPVTQAPITLSPDTQAPITLTPVTQAPITLSPVTQAPITLSPVTQAPATTSTSTATSISQSTPASLPSTTGAAPTTGSPVTRPVILPGPPCAQVGFFPHPTICSHFFRCLNLTEDHSSFQKVEFACGEGTVFDVSISICNHPALVPGCEHHTTHTPAPPTGSSTALPASTTQAIATETPTTSLPLITSSPAFVTSTATSQPITSQPSTTQAQVTWPSSTTPAPTTQPPLTQAPVTSPASTVSPASTTQSTITSTESSSVQPPTTASSIIPPSGPHCSEAGFFRSPNNCSLFYRCVNTTVQGPPFNRYEFNCGHGSVFDTSINVCNHPQNVPGCGGQVTPPPPLPVAPGSTTPAELPVSSSSSTTSSIVASSSTPSATVGSTTLPPITEPVTSPAVASSTTAVVPISPSTLPPSSLVTVVVPSPPSGGEEALCFGDGFFRDPKDCARFSRCVLNNSSKIFVKYDFVCGSGSVFDLSIMVCNHPSAVPGCETYVPTSTTAPPCNQTTGTGESGSTASPGTSAPPSPTTTQAATTSTEAAAITTSSTTITTTTTTTTEAPAITTVTATEAIAISSSSTQAGVTLPPLTMAPPQSLVTVSTTQVITSAPTTPHPLPSTSRRPPSIVRPCVVEGFFINPNNCTRFYRCIDLTGNATRFQKINFNCPPGTAFDDSINVCNHAHMTTCIIGGGTRAPPTGSTPPAVSTTSTAASVVTSSETTTTSATVTTGPSTLPPTSSSSQPPVTSPSTTQPPPSTTQLTPSTSQLTPSTSQLTPSTTQLTPSTTQLTPSTTQLTPSTAQPSPPTTAQSSTSAPTAAPSTAAPTLPTLEVSSVGTTVSPTSTSSRRPPPIGEICLAEGKFSDPTDCSKFYLCQDLLGDGSNFHMCEVECPDDTYFSPALGYCSDRVLPNSCFEGHAEVEHPPTVEGALPFNHYLHLLNTRARRHSQS